MQASCVALSDSRRLFLRSLSLVNRRSLASAVSEPRPAKTVRLYLYELPRRLDNRVSSSSALSEARRIFLRYLSLVYSQILQFYARVVVELELRYVQRRAGASQPSRT